MSRVVYDWKRFWCPRGGHIDLLDRGFLVDPEGDLAKYYPSDVVPFESIAHFPCLGLLGTPGMGKSKTLDHLARENALGDSRDEVMRVDLREFQTDQRLVQKVFASPKMEQWRKGSHTLHLFFDSLDEALLRIDNIAAVLSSELRELPAERLRLRIACRAADWPNGLETTVRSIWGEDQVGVFVLAPLRRADVVVAAKSNGIDDSEGFLHEVGLLGVAPFANRPVTLQFLMNSFKRRGCLPASRAELYREGCRCLCEPSESRRDAKALGKLTSRQCVEIASRLAAVTVFSGRFAIWTGPDDGDVPDEDVLLIRVAGGKEGNGPTETAADAEAIRETLDTGLFSSRGINRSGWEHQTYAEFLAAHYLHAHQVPLAASLRLLVHPDGSGKIVPQLRETAAWLAGLDPSVFRAFAQTDPETLLRGDLAGATTEDRAELVRQLLAAFDAGDLLEDHNLWQYYELLACPTLPEILRPYLRDAPKAPAARLAAIEIARACRVTALQSDLVGTALDTSAPHRVRVRAASAAGEIGDASARGALKRILTETADDDPDDGLKAAALKACWPDQMTAQELLAVLTPPKDSHLIGAYFVFLRSDIAATVREQDLTVALLWATAHLPGDADLNPLTKLALGIVERAIDHLDQAGIPDLVAQALAAQWPFLPRSGWVVERLRSSAEARRLVAPSMVPLVAKGQHAALTLLEACALSSCDVPWLLSELTGTRPESELQVLCSVIVWILDPNDVDIVDAVHHACESNPLLRAAIRPRIEAVPLGSAQAEEMKEWHRLQEPRARAPEGPEDTPDARSIEGHLNKHGDNAFPHIWDADWRARQSLRTAELLVGWSTLDQGLRARVLEAAYRYLADYRTTDETAWWRQGQFPWYALAAYDALCLLYVEGPALFAALPEEAWAVWAWVAVSGLPNDSAGQQVHERIVESAYRKAPDTVIRVLGEVLDGENERHGTIFVFQQFGGLWDDRIADVVRGKLSIGDLKLGSFQALLSKLLEMGDVAARARAELIVTGEIPASGQKRYEAVVAAKELIRHNADAAWHLVWPLLQRDREFGMAVLGGVAYGLLPGEPGLTGKLSEDQIADILIWLPFDKTDRCDGRGEFVTPASALRTWSEHLPGYLADRGTIDACRAIQRVMAARPELDWLKWYLRNAQELARRNTWIPIPPEDLMQMVSSPSARWIRNGNDLTEVVVESLSRLQDLLQGETPASIDLWNEIGRERDDGAKERRRVFRPKDEPCLSDYIKRHLDRDLRDRGVIVNREVEIRRSFGASPGEETDIHVNVAVRGAEPNTLDKVTVIIEVKGSWNRDLGHAMRTQLVDRYMRDNECRHGVYVVGWFGCQQWDPEDDRRKRAPKISIDDARRQFEAQAADLSTNGIVVRAVVLNTALR